MQEFFTRNKNLLKDALETFNKYLVRVYKFLVHVFDVLMLFVNYCKTSKPIIFVPCYLYRPPGGPQERGARGSLNRLKPRFLSHSEHHTL